MNHTERLKRYHNMAIHQRNIIFYGRNGRVADSYMPPEWVVYRERHGHDHPGYCRHMRFMRGEEGWA